MLIFCFWICKNLSFRFSFEAVSSFFLSYCFNEYFFLVTSLFLSCYMNLSLLKITIFLQKTYSPKNERASRFCFLQQNAQSLLEIFEPIKLFRNREFYWKKIVNPKDSLYLLIPGGLKELTLQFVLSWKMNQKSNSKSTLHKIFIFIQAGTLVVICELEKTKPN